MTLPVMATQIDPLSSRSFKKPRPWRRRDASSGRSYVSGRTSGSSSGITDNTPTTRQVRSGTVDGEHSESPSPSPSPLLPLSSLSLSPSPPSSRPSSGRRSRSRTVVSTPALSVLPSSPSPAFLYPYSPDSAHMGLRPSPGIAYTFTGVARSPTTPTNLPETPSDDDYLQSLDSSPQNSQPDRLEEATSLSSSPSSLSDKTSQSVQQPASKPSDGPGLQPGLFPNSSTSDGGFSLSLSLKRRRALSDVDGPNTGILCCKKRRLRRFLITSRLSQPFSQPASHILNRESVASGDKRFLKLAAIMNARRIRSPHAVAAGSTSISATMPPPPQAVWRAAMANRFRKRIFADTAMGRSIAGAPLQLMNSARLALVPVSTAASMAAVRASASGAALVPSPAKLPFIANTKPESQAVPAGAGASSNGTNNSSIAPLRRARSHSRSPRLRPVRDRDSRHNPVEEDYPRPSLIDDEGDCAFPTSEHGSSYEVDDYDDEDSRPDDEVYADFSVLFGSISDDTDWGSGNEEGLDDYMDELDGISHLPR